MGLGSLFKSALGSLFGLGHVSSREIEALRAERDLLLGERGLLERRIDELTLCGAPSEKDRTLYQMSIPLKFDLWDWLADMANKESSEVLEVGSREVVGKSRCKERLAKANYTGFDFHAGPNVDVVGDAHRLSRYFSGKKFDVVYSAAVFEHLAMPWVVAEEISSVLRVGGVACIATHFSFSEHEMPWHYFQFNSTSLEVLFNADLGFETVAAGKELPMVGRFAYDCDADHAGKPIANLYCSSYIVTKKVREGQAGGSSDRFDWRGALSGVYGDTQYPADASVVKA